MSVENVLGAQRPPVRIGIAGLGRAALFDHIPAFKALPGLYQVMAVCDLVKERRDIVEKDYPDVHTYRRVEDMLDDPEIDLVLVTFPTADHFSTALSSLRRERWTVVEAPLTTSHDDAKVLQAASVKARHKLYPYTPGLFAPDFRLAQSVLDDARLGEIFEVRVRVQDYVRRDDWQSVKRCLGGCAWYRGQDALLQAVTLMRAQPAQLWSELKRLVSLGDAERPQIARRRLRRHRDLRRPSAALRAVLHRARHPRLLLRPPRRHDGHAPCPRPRLQVHAPPFQRPHAPPRRHA